MYKKNQFEIGLQNSCKEIEASVYRNAWKFFDCVEEANARNVEVEVVLAERAAKAAAELYQNIMENMNPQQWA